MGFTKIRREIEPRWVSQYIKEFYAKAEAHLRCPLGPIPEEYVKMYGPAKAANIYRPWRPEVDALVVLEGAIVLIEAKIQKYMDGLAKLPVYKALIPSTPEFMPISKTRPTIMHLLLPYPIPWVKTAAAVTGVEVIDWAPDWVVEIWEERDKYWTPEYRLKREARKALLKRLQYY